MFLPFILYGRPVTFLLVADLLETFSKDCAKELKRRRRDHCFAIWCEFSREDEPHESVSHATFWSMVRPYFVYMTAILSNEMAIFENCKAFCLLPFEV